jgi:hypothetical protein
VVYSSSRAASSETPRPLCRGRFWLFSFGRNFSAHTNTLGQQIEVEPLVAKVVGNPQVQVLESRRRQGLGFKSSLNCDWPCDHQPACDLHGDTVAAILLDERQ